MRRNPGATASNVPNFGTSLAKKAKNASNVPFLGTLLTVRATPKGSPENVEGLMVMEDEPSQIHLQTS